tara:strand:- start:621 stop:1034 length:414 start_codon:yes stop_codon:yes gene_type:complete
MNRLIAVVIALVLSACSYDPYHYYAYCNSGDKTKTTYRDGRLVDREVRNVPATYFHNGVLHNLNNRRDEPYYFFVKEDEQYVYFQRYDREYIEGLNLESYLFRFNKETKEIYRGENRPCRDQQKYLSPRHTEKLIYG